MPIANLSIFFFLIGVALALVGTITGVVQAFNESAVWGLLYLFVPFGALVFVVRHWREKPVRRSLFYTLGGFVLMFASLLIGALLQSYSYSNRPSNREPLKDVGLDSGNFEVVTPESALRSPATNTIDSEATFREAINLATEAAELTQTASTKEDWTTVANTWQQSIEKLYFISPGDPNYEKAQTKITEYGANLDYAQKNAQ